MQLYGKTSGLLRSEVWFKEVECQTGDKIKTSILGTPFLCVNILHVVETRHNTTKRASSPNVRKWAITLDISFEGECKLKWKKKRKKRKEKKEKDRKESARLGLEPYTFGLWRSRFLRSAGYAVWLFSQVWHWQILEAYFISLSDIKYSSRITDHCCFNFCRQAAIQTHKEAPHRVIKIDATKASVAKKLLHSILWNNHDKMWWPGDG